MAATLYGNTGYQTYLNVNPGSTLSMPEWERLMERESALRLYVVRLCEMLGDPRATCPICYRPNRGWEPERLLMVVIHLYDNHKWTREDIADWLDTLPLDLTLQHPSMDRA